MIGDDVIAEPLLLSLNLPTNLCIYIILHAGPSPVPRLLFSKLCAKRGESGNEEIQAAFQYFILVLIIIVGLQYQTLYVHQYLIAEVGRVNGCCLEKFLVMCSDILNFFTSIPEA